MIQFGRDYTVQARIQFSGRTTAAWGRPSGGRLKVPAQRGGRAMRPGVYPRAAEIAGAGGSRRIDDSVEADQFEGWEKLEPAPGPGNGQRVCCDFEATKLRTRKAPDIPAREPIFHCLFLMAVQPNSNI